MISLVRKPNPLSRLPLQGPHDNYKDEGPTILLPLLDYLNWIAWTDNSKSGLILARVTRIQSGESVIAVVGSADLEENTYGDIYMTQYLMELLHIASQTDLVRIEPYTDELAAGTNMTVAHECELAAELRLNIFERLQETIMDWPIIHLGGAIDLVFPDAGNLRVTLTVTGLEPAAVVQLGGELALEINGPGEAVAATADDENSITPWSSSDPDPGSIYVPKTTWDYAGEGKVLGDNETKEETTVLTADERRRLVRESWAKR